MIDSSCFASINSFSIIGGGSSRKLESQISPCPSMMTKIGKNINLISRWFVMIVCS